jgi:hypothetical protein
VSTIEELLGRNSSDSGLESQEYDLLARKPNTHTRIWKLTETQQKQTQIRNCRI